MSDNLQEVVNFIILHNKLDYKIRINRLTKHFYAGEAINSGKAVYVDVDQKIYILDPAVPSELLRYVGIAETNTPIGGEAIVATHGLSSVQGSGWQSGVAYYIDSDGSLTATPGNKQVGVGVGPDRILLISSGSGGSSSSLGECWDALDGGNADGSMDGGGATSVFSEIIDGGDAPC